MTFVLNIVIGICMGRLAGSAWLCLLLVPLVGAELIYVVLVHNLPFVPWLRRGAALLMTAELAFLLGMLLKPIERPSNLVRSAEK